MRSGLIWHANCYFTRGMALYVWFGRKVPSPDKDIRSLRGCLKATHGSVTITIKQKGEEATQLREMRARVFASEAEKVG